VKVTKATKKSRGGFREAKLTTRKKIVYPFLKVLFQVSKLSNKKLL